VFTALLCYAKITPAALQRGDFAERCGKDAEAAGRKPKFELSGFLRVVASAAVPAAQRPGWHQVKQGVPDA
jgi:hypothetical protein